MMRKKTIYAVLMTVLVTSFTGCGQKEDTNAVDVVVVSFRINQG